MATKLKTIAIKGKDYVTVNERVKYLLENMPGYSIQTEIVTINADSVTMKASIVDQDGNVVSTGHAQEERGASNINKTSYVENCETSAVGRALGFLGIGIDASISTADEVQAAVERQMEMEKPITKSAKMALEMLIKDTGADMARFLEHFQVASIEKMNMWQWNEAMKMLGKKSTK